MEHLETEMCHAGVDFDWDDNCIHCFPHIINIAVQHLLSELISISNGAEDTEFLPHAAGDEDLQSYQQALARDPISLCRAVVRNLHVSSIRHEEFGRITRALLLPSLQLLRDVDTRWDSVYEMIDRAIEMRQAIDHYTNNSDFWHAHKNVCLTDME
ncbi:hypothetical protein FRB94_006659 [Tulasnella sp. JGI-2019a]|nr:hypothetical protein FRB94_006659 [Tulasnella sp. JGI-2019a]